MHLHKGDHIQHLQKIILCSCSLYNIPPSIDPPHAHFLRHHAWAVGLAGRIKGFLGLFMFILGSFWAGHSFVTFISTVVPVVITGSLVAVSLLAQFMLSSGFFVTRVRIPRFWMWFHYISLVKYPYQGVILNEFEKTKKCLVSEIQMFDNTPLKGALEDLKIRVLKSIGRSLGANSASSCLFDDWF